MQYHNLVDINQHVDKLVLRLSQEAGMVDLQPFFFDFTLSTTTALIFGQSIAVLPENEQQSFGRSFDYASAVCAMRMRLAEFYWTYTPLKYIQACNVVKGFATEFVDQALEFKDGSREDVRDRYAFIYDLYDELKDRRLVRDQLAHVLIAGRDTTACLLSWALWVDPAILIGRCSLLKKLISSNNSFLLVRHPKVLNRLRWEIHSTMPEEGGLNRTTIQKMSYLRCVLNES